MNLLTKITLISTLTLTIFSCAKPGCMDSDAVNYSASAKKEDGSCNYKEKIIFWQDQATSEVLQSAGITGLYIYVDGELIGSSLTTNYWTGAPSCSQSGNVSAEINMGNQKSKVINVEIRDNDDILLVSDTYTMVAGDCNVVQL
jgi:hypothetical protein